MNVPINAKRLRATLPDVVERVPRSQRARILKPSTSSPIFVRHTTRDSSIHR
jgi:hypothetical protein